MTRAVCWLVCSRRFQYIEPVLFDGVGGGPIETSCLVVYVRTRTAQRAKTLALRHWRRTGEWDRTMEDDENPFSGMIAERIRLWGPVPA